ncbi:MAG: hypothetical protein ACRDI0_01040 [Actinomycetota bacterium]
MGLPMRLPTRLWLGGLAAGGAALTHVLAFVVAAPDPVRRGRLLEETGHAAWPVIVSVALAALVVALARFAVGRIHQADLPAPGALWRLTAGRLMVLQTLAFVGLEAVERLTSGHELDRLLVEPVVLIGVVLQVVVSLGAATLLVLLAHLVDRLTDLLRTLPRAPRVLGCPRAWDGLLPRPRLAAGPVNPRGPPGEFT